MLGKARLWIGRLKVVFKHIGTAGIFGLLFALVFERWLHTPFYVYPTLFALFVLILVCGDRVFIWVYKRFTKLPHIRIEEVDYSGLMCEGQLIIHIVFRTESTLKIKRFSVSVKPLSTIYTSQPNISEKEQIIGVKVKARNDYKLTIPLMVVSENFRNEAEGNSRMGRQMLLNFSFIWVINPILLGMTISEDIFYPLIVNYPPA